MFCSCGRRRRAVLPEVQADILPAPMGAAKSPPRPFIATVSGFTPEPFAASAAQAGLFTSLTPEPLMLTIRIPKRTRWAPHDEEHKNLFVEKTRSSLEHIGLLPKGEKRFRGAIILFNDIIAQPMVLAMNSSFRGVAALKFQELEEWFKEHPRTRFADEFTETNYQWHELMAELHDHPLYKED